MARPQPIVTKSGQKPGELIVSLPPGWELRLRRILREVGADSLPNPREKGLTPAQREARIQARRRRLQQVICQYLSDLLTADIVGKEVALATRNRFGTRKGSLREHVQAIIQGRGEGL
jgi:hypothetical protein